MGGRKGINMAIKTNLGALSRFYSHLASFFTDKKVTVLVTTNDKYVGYTSFPDKNGKVEIVLSFTSALYSLEGKAIPEDEKTFYILGVLTHECLHQLFTNFTARRRIADSYTTPSHRDLFLQVDNIVEDSAIEWAAPTKFGGKMLRALYAVIALTYKNAPPIDEMDGQPIPPFLAESFALVQILNALIQVGDRGEYKGEFLSDLARKTWAKVLPLFNKGVLEPKGKARCEISKKITDLLIPLLAKQEKIASAIQQAMQDSKEHQGKGEGQDIPDGAGSSEHNKASQAKREELEKKAKGGKSKDKASAEAKDGADDLKSGSEGTKDESEGKSEGKGTDAEEKKSEGKNKDKGKGEDKSKGDSDNAEGANGSGDKGDSDKSGKGNPNSSGSDGEGEGSKNSEHEGRSKPGTVGYRDDDELKVSKDDLSEIAQGIEDAAEQIKEEAKKETAQLNASCGDYEPNSATIENRRVALQGDSAYNDIVARYQLRIKTLSRTLKNLFIGDYGGNKNSSRGSRINVKRVASPVLHPDIMISRQAPKDLSDMAVYILIDESGSMSDKIGDKTNIACAREVAISLYEALHALGIPLYVTGFSTSGGKAVHRHCMTWNTPYSKRSALYGLSAGGCNYDYYSISEANKILSKHPAKHKILIVLSDGQPCGTRTESRYIEPKAATKKAVDDTRKSGVSVLGVAMNCTDPDTYNLMYGKDYIKVRTAGDMFGPIVSTMKRIVQKW